MTQMKAALSELKAALVVAKEKAERYAKQVDNIEVAIAMISAIEPPKTNGKAKPAKAAAPIKEAPQPEEDKLPSIPTEYWVKLLAGKRVTKAKLLAKSMKDYGVTDDSPNLKKLKMRLDTALLNNVAAGIIQRDDSGKEPVYSVG